jgi:biotin synthase
MVALTRLLLPNALIPSTTALGTIAENGRELGIKAGANVVMPNLSPVRVRKEYSLYDNKICTGEESAQCRMCLERRIESAGYKAVTDIGNVRR